MINNYLKRIFSPSWKVRWFDKNTYSSFLTQTLAHEIGHNLGMSHDFDEKHQGKNCDKKGIMSYGDAPTAWSSCSISDFTDYYLAAKWGEHCMKGKNRIPGD